MPLKNLSAFLRADEAENSIMQTITIAVSAILIAAGLVTAPGLINNARDNNATTDLANIAYAEEALMGETGEYSTSITASSADVDGNWLGNRTALKYTLSGSVESHEALICASPNFYVIKATSSSGKTFYRSSASGATSTDVSKLGINGCITSQPAWASFAGITTPPVETPDDETPGGGTPPVDDPEEETPPVEEPEVPEEPEIPAAPSNVITIPGGGTYTVTGDATFSYTVGSSAGGVTSYIFTVVGTSLTPSEWTVQADWNAVTGYHQAKGFSAASLANSNQSTAAKTYTYRGIDRSWNANPAAANNYKYITSDKAPIVFTIQVSTN